METLDGRGVILDSSVWVAFLHDGDSQHAAAQKILARIGDEIIVPEYILVEVATILKRRKGAHEAQRFVRRVLREQIESFLPADLLAYETAELFCERNDTLSFTDTALLILSREYRIITFDKALAKALAQCSS